MDIIPIVFSIVIPIDVAFFLAHMYYSTKYIPNQQEKLYYYLTSIIPIAPAIMYSFSLVDYIVDDGGPTYYDGHYLEIFFKTWIVSNPLLLINLGKIIDIELYKYMWLIIADIIMYIFGYISYRTHDRNVYVSCLTLASLCFLIIMGHITYYYYHVKHKNPEITMLPFYKWTMRIIILTWMAYPIVFLLYKEGLYGLEPLVLAFIALDFLTKSVFSSIILQYHVILNRKKSYVQYMAHSQHGHEYGNAQVLPIELVPSPFINADIEYAQEQEQEQEPNLDILKSSSAVIIE